jgi:hypothetical protein
VLQKSWMSKDATEPLPVNDTIIMDITDTDDVDIDPISLKEVSIVLTNTGEASDNEEEE